MANILLSFRNWIDEAGVALSASHEATTLPAANVAIADIKKIWRSAGSTTPWLRADLGAARAIRVLAVAGLARLAASDTIRWRLGTSAGAGDVYDSGAVACGRVSGYARAFCVLPASVTARHVQLDFAATSQNLSPGYVDCGRLWAGDALQPARNYSYGAARGFADESTQQPADRAPATVYVDPKAPEQIFAFQLDGLTEAEAWAVQDALLFAGSRKQVLVIPDSASAYVARDGLIGLMKKADPLRHTNFPIRSAAFEVRGAILEE